MQTTGAHFVAKGVSTGGSIIYIYTTLETRTPADLFWLTQLEEKTQKKNFQKGITIEKNRVLSHDIGGGDPPSWTDWTEPLTWADPRAIYTYNVPLYIYRKKKQVGNNRFSFFLLFVEKKRKEKAAGGINAKGLLAAKGQRDSARLKVWNMIGDLSVGS